MQTYVVTNDYQGIEIYSRDRDGKPIYEGQVDLATARLFTSAHPAYDMTDWASADEAIKRFERHILWCAGGSYCYGLHTEAATA